MDNIKKALIFIIMLAIFMPVISYGYGLETGFGKVILEDVPIGIRYSMRKNAEFPLTIKNTSDRKVKLKLEVLIPGEEEIQEEYEAIPAVSWVELEKDELIIEPHSEADTDVVISVPDNEEYIGRKFQVFIWSRTIEESLGVGIKSKLLIQIADSR